MRVLKRKCMFCPLKENFSIIVLYLIIIVIFMKALCLSLTIDYVIKKAPERIHWALQ